MDYWAFVNTFEVHVASRIQDDDLQLAYVVQHCTKSVYDKVKHIAGNKDKSFAYRMIWQELYARYGQPHVIARYSENCLQMFHRLAANDVEGLEELAVLLKRCFAAIEETSTTIAIHSPSFIVTVAEKLPIESKRKWMTFSLKCKKKKSTDSRLLKLC